MRAKNEIEDVFEYYSYLSKRLIDKKLETHRLLFDKKADIKYEDEDDLCKIIGSIEALEMTFYEVFSRYIHSTKYRQHIKEPFCDHIVTVLERVINNSNDKSDHTTIMVKFGLSLLKTINEEWEEIKCQRSKQ